MIRVKCSGLWVGALSTAAVACGFADSGTLDSVVRADSSGVEIVFNPGSDGIQPYRPEPGLEIATSSDGEYVLFRVTAVALDEQGALIVANGGSHEILVFDAATGALKQRFGRRGRGPGEFSMPAGVWLRGDSVVVYDARGGSQGAIMVFRDGAMLRSTEVAAPIAGGSFRAVGFAAADSSLIWQSDRVFFRGAQAQDSLIIYRGDIAGGDLHIVGGATHTLSYGIEIGGDLQRGNTPLSPNASVAATERGFLVSDGRAFEVREYDATGAHLRTLRLDRSRSAAGSDARRRYRADIERRFPAAGADPGFQRLLATVQFPDSLPAYDQVIAGADGEVWARLYDIESSTPRSWHVFRPDGALDTEVVLPAGFELHAVTRNLLAGVGADELGAATIRTLRRPAVLSVGGSQ